MRNDDHLIFENYFNKLTQQGHKKCEYAEEGCECDECKDCQANQTKSEDAESSDSIAIKELHNLVASLNHHYLSGKDLDNETLGDIAAELEDILNVGFGSPHEDEESVEEKMAKIEAKRAQRKNIGEVRPKASEDAETFGVEGKIKAALQEVESTGYTGDHIDPVEVAKLVVGSQGDWGDSYESLVQALGHVIEAYYGKGLQDS